MTQRDVTVQIAHILPPMAAPIEPADITAIRVTIETSFSSEGEGDVDWFQISQKAPAYRVGHFSVGDDDCE